MVTEVSVLAGGGSNYGGDCSGGDGGGAVDNVNLG